MQQKQKQVSNFTKIKTKTGINMLKNLNLATKFSN